MIKRIISSILLIMLILTGCSSQQTSKITTEAVNTIYKVSNIYGERNPKIKLIDTTKDETTNKQMYIVSLNGNFVDGVHKSRKLEFSITEDGKKVWALTSDSWQVPDVKIN